jgi:hypothetical protein
MRLDSIYIVYWSFQDPLCQSQSLPVLRGLARRGWRLGLVTYDQEHWRMAPADQQAAQEALRAEGIEWLPLRYHKRPAVLSTIADIVIGVWQCMRFARASGARLLHGRGTIPAAIAWGAALLSGGRFFNDADGPLSEEYVDAGIWRRGSLPHRITAWVERRTLRAADAVAVLNDRRRRESQPGARAEIAVLPCAVDTAHYVGDRAAGDTLRTQLDLDGTVFVYSGKSGGWYLTLPMLDFVKEAGQVLGPVSLLILTTEDPARFAAPATERGLKFAIRKATRAEMPRYLSAGHVGLSFRMDTPSQRACSPIKNGEYLACGLPVAATAGAGDYSDLVVRERVGVVIDGFDTATLRAAAERLRDLLADPALATRCREVAVREVGLAEVVVPRYVGLYEGLLSAPSSGSTEVVR